jgi:hypothetical protein
VCAIVQEKLSHVPCFFVGDRRGACSIMSLQGGVDVGLVFIDHRDAQDLAKELRKVRPSRTYPMDSIPGQLVGHAPQRLDP